MVANLEDLVTDLKKTGKQMETTFNNYLSKRESYQAQIETFDDDVAVLLQVIRITENEKRIFLGKFYLQIPVFPALLKWEATESMAGSVGGQSPYPEGTKISLLDWINSGGSSNRFQK